jgi:hypothetical protein
MFVSAEIAAERALGSKQRGIIGDAHRRDQPGGL